MFSLLVLALAVASAGAHSFSHVRRHHVPRSLPPKAWQTGYLEDYDKYHTRYEAIGCGNKHGTPFFDTCCHPLLASETVAKHREPCCAVGATVACHNSAPAYTAAASPAKSSPAKNSPAKSSPAKTNSAAAPAKTTAAGDDDEDCDEDDGDDDDDNDNDDDGEDCEDEGGEPSASYAAPTSTKVAPKTSSHAVAPTTTSTQTTPKETTTAKAEPTYTTPTATPAPTTSASTGDKSSGNFIFGGFGTWFLQGGQKGACGKLHQDTDFVVALETKTYANGIHCGRGIQICDTKNGKCVNGIVADECPTCTNPQSVDMSRSMFEGLAALSVGEFDIKWAFT